MHTVRPRGGATSHVKERAVVGSQGAPAVLKKLSVCPGNGRQTSAIEGGRTTCTSFAHRPTHGLGTLLVNRDRRRAGSRACVIVAGCVLVWAALGGILLLLLLLLQFELRVCRTAVCTHTTRPTGIYG